MIANKKEFGGGVALLVLFSAVMIFMFQPVFDGHNSMEYLDKLYNSISKGSVYYIPALSKDADTLDSKNVDIALTYGSEIEADQSANLFAAAGATAAKDGRTLTVTGSLGTILDGTLADADLMYYNKEAEMADKYGLQPRRTMFNWWTSLKLMDKALKDAGEFEAAKIVSTIEKKAVEATYNYFKVEPVHIMDNLGTVIFSLAFYVFYTLWYGFAILFIFEGWGLRLSH